MDWPLLALSVIRTASAACATILALFAYRAYRATHRVTMRWFTLASVLLVVGFLGAGLLYQATGDLMQATVFEAPFTTGALLVLMASLFGPDVRRVRRKPREPPERTEEQAAPGQAGSIRTFP